MKAVGSFETSGTVYPVTQRHIPEDQKLCHYEKHKTRKKYRMHKCSGRGPRRY